MRESEREAGLRVLARHQWVRDHGTPRASTLVGEPGVADGLWREWLQLSGRGCDEASTHIEPSAGGARWLSEVAPQVLASARDTPGRPLAILVRAASLHGWSSARTDRVAAFVSEGVIDVTGVDEGVSDATVAVESVEPPGTLPPALAHAPARASAEKPHIPAIAARARSVAEAALFDALEATPSTAGRFQLNQSASFAFGARAAELDLLSRDDELVIEIDGYHHFTDPDHYRRDRRKDRLLQAHGYVVLRFLAEDVLADPRAAVTAVTELLGVRRGRAERTRKP